MEPKRLALLPEIVDICKSQEKVICDLFLGWIMGAMKITFLVVIVPNRTI